MADVPSRQLRNETRSILARAEAGEAITITVDGRPVAALTAITRRPTFVTRSTFLATFQGNQADPGLRAELVALAPDTTDDLPW